MKNESYLVIAYELGAWGRGGSVAEATAAFVKAFGAVPGPKAKVDVLRIFWRTDDARSEARKFDKHRASEGHPSWVNPDGSPFVYAGEGVTSRPRGTDVHAIVSNGRYDNGVIVARASR